MTNPEHKPGAAFLFCSPAARYPPDPPGPAAPFAAASSGDSIPTRLLKPLPMRTPPYFLPRCTTLAVSEPPEQQKKPKKPTHPISKRGANQCQITPQPYGQGSVIGLSLADLTLNRDHNLLSKSRTDETLKTLTMKKLWVSPVTSIFSGKGQSRWLRSPQSAQTATGAQQNHPSKWAGVKNPSERTKVRHWSTLHKLLGYFKPLIPLLSIKICRTRDWRKRGKKCKDG